MFILIGIFRKLLYKVELHYKASGIKPTIKSNLLFFFLKKPTVGERKFLVFNPYKPDRHSFHGTFANRIARASGLELFYLPPSENKIIMKNYS